MIISISFILLSLGVKCLLNWVLVFVQRSHICQSFLGVFSVTQAVIDTALTLFVAVIYLQTHGYVILLGFKLTRFHVCLLVQILGQVYSNLHWPVIILAGLDHLCTLTQRLQITVAKARWPVCLFVTSLLWYLTAFYVFLLSDFNPVLEDVPYNQIQQCWVFHTSEILQVIMLLLLSLGSAVLHAGCSTRLLKDQSSNQTTKLSRKSVVYKAIHIFLRTWALFLFVLTVLSLLPVGIPAYLGLNVAWLSFLNSMLIAVLLCAVCPASQLMQGLAAVPPDSFCKWKFKFSLAAEDRT
ncbi:probable G-protein coupled receptor 160 [Xyrichtys novacula]|uniref:Probable G-protein coupled receptor 160 n=1 Tax=Xyrichtys novacula TaxID=13765 RepID=A0AAV1GJP8_XYRNO|nr:probable G-protein coupled receptor 160 [Xyrichtys novacula]